MNQEIIEGTINKVVIDDCSFAESLSEPEADVNFELNIKAKPASHQQRQFKMQIESDEDRLRRFEVEPSDLDSLFTVGLVDSITNNTVVVKSNQDILNIDNLVFFKLSGKATVLGKVDDIFGPVDDPYYSVRIDNYLRSVKGEMDSMMAKKGIKVYVVRDSAVFLEDEEIQSMKLQSGTDASYQQDREMCFSDDESEFNFNNQTKNKYFAKRSNFQGEFADTEGQGKVKNFGIDLSSKEFRLPTSKDFSEDAGLNQFVNQKAYVNDAEGNFVLPGAHRNFRKNH